MYIFITYYFVMITSKDGSASSPTLAVMNYPSTCLNCRTRARSANILPLFYWYSRTFSFSNSGDSLPYEIHKFIYSKIYIW